MNRVGLLQLSLPSTRSADKNVGITLSIITENVLSLSIKGSDVQRRASRQRYDRIGSELFTAFYSLIVDLFL